MNRLIVTYGLVLRKLIEASVIAAIIVGASFGVLVSLYDSNVHDSWAHLLAAPIGASLFGLFIGMIVGMPAILVGAGVCTYFLKKGIVRRIHFVLVGACLGELTGLALHNRLVPPWLFLVGGVVASLLVHSHVKAFNTEELPARRNQITPDPTLSTLTPGELRTLSRWVKLFLALGIIGGLLGILHKVHMHFDPGAERHYGHVTHVHIGGRDFAVPDEYIRGPRPRGAQSRQLYLWMMLPDYMPYDGELEPGKDLESAWPRHLSVLIDDTALTTDLQHRYNVGRNNYFKIPKEDGDRYGLHKTNIYLKRPEDSQPALLEELYSATNSDGRIVTFIDCDRDDPDVHPHPMCATHEFQDGRLLYIIGYRKTNLAQWRNIQNHVHSVIESFSCVSKSNPTSSTPTNGAKPCPP